MIITCAMPHTARNPLHTVGKSKEKMFCREHCFVIKLWKVVEQSFHLKFPLSRIVGCFSKMVSDVKDDHVFSVGGHGWADVELNLLSHLNLICPIMSGRHTASKEILNASHRDYEKQTNKLGGRAFQLFGIAMMHFVMC